MLDSTEQVPSITSPPVSSPDTPIVSDNLPVIEWKDTYATPEQLAATAAKLAPYLTKEQFKAFVQEEDDEEVLG